MCIFLAIKNTEGHLSSPGRFSMYYVQLENGYIGIKKDKSSTFIGCKQKLDLTNSLKHQLQMGMKCASSVMKKLEIIEVRF
jgi:hypothetical protein